jgi:hypothetical protein
MSAEIAAGQPGERRSPNGIEHLADRRSLGLQFTSRITNDFAPRSSHQGPGSPNYRPRAVNNLTKWSTYGRSLFNSVPKGVPTAVPVPATSSSLRNVAADFFACGCLPRTSPCTVHHRCCNCGSGTASIIWLTYGKTTRGSPTDSMPDGRSVASGKRGAAIESGRWGVPGLTGVRRTSPVRTDLEAEDSAGSTLGDPALALGTDCTSCRAEAGCCDPSGADGNWADTPGSAAARRKEL